MGVFYTLMLGDVETVRASLEAGQLWQQPDQFTAKYLSHLALGDLFTLLLGKPFEIDPWLDQAVDEDDGNIIYSFIPTDCIQLLASLPPDHYPSVAQQWAATEQLYWDFNFPPPRPLGWPQNWIPKCRKRWEAQQAEKAANWVLLIQDYLEETCRLAALSQARQQPLCLICMV